MTDTALDPHLAVYAPPDGPMRAASDETGQVVVFSTHYMAELFAARLAVHGFRAVAWPTHAQQVVDLLLAAGVSAEEAPERISVFEAQTLGEADAERWCLELADRLADGQEDENGHDGGTDITF